MQDRNKLLELSEVMKIQVPADFMLNRHILVHPDYIKALQDYLSDK